MDKVIIMKRVNAPTKDIHIQHERIYNTKGIHMQQERIYNTKDIHIQHEEYTHTKQKMAEPLEM